MFFPHPLNIASLTLLGREPLSFHVVKNVSKDCMKINMYLILILKSPLPIMSFIRISVLRSNGKYFFLSSMGFFFSEPKYIESKKDAVFYEANSLIINKMCSVATTIGIKPLLK